MAINIKTVELSPNPAVTNSLISVGSEMEEPLTIGINYVVGSNVKNGLNGMHILPDYLNQEVPIVTDIATATSTYTHQFNGSSVTFKQINDTLGLIPDNLTHRVLIYDETGTIINYVDLNALAYDNIIINSNHTLNIQITAVIYNVNLTNRSAIVDNIRYNFIINRFDNPITLNGNYIDINGQNQEIAINYNIEGTIWYPGGLLIKKDNQPSNRTWATNCLYADVIIKETTEADLGGYTDIVNVDLCEYWDTTDGIIGFQRECMYKLETSTPSFFESVKYIGWGEPWGHSTASQYKEGGIYDLTTPLTLRQTGETLTYCHKTSHLTNPDKKCNILIPDDSTPFIFNLSINEITVTDFCFYKAGEEKPNLIINWHSSTNTLLNLKNYSMDSGNDTFLTHTNDPVWINNCKSNAFWSTATYPTQSPALYNLSRFKDLNSYLDIYPRDFGSNHQLVVNGAGQCMELKYYKVSTLTIIKSNVEPDDPSTYPICPMISYFNNLEIINNQWGSPIKRFIDLSNTALTSISLNHPNGCIVERYCFENNKKLTELNINTSPEKLETNAFDGCTLLKTINVNCNILDKTIYENINTIGTSLGATINWNVSQTHATHSGGVA